MSDFEREFEEKKYFNKISTRKLQNLLIFLLLNHSLLFLKIKTCSRYHCPPAKAWKYFTDTTTKRSKWGIHLKQLFLPNFILLTFNLINKSILPHKFFARKKSISHALAAFKGHRKATNTFSSYQGTKLQLKVPKQKTNFYQKTAFTQLHRSEFFFVFALFLNLN